MKKLFDIYEYLYYRTFIWQKRLNGEKWAMFSAAYLPMILFLVHFILPILLLLDLYVYPLNDKTIVCIAFVIAICLSNYYDNRHNLIIDRYKRTSIYNNKLYVKRVWMLVVSTIVWIIITFVIYQMLRPDEVQSPYPSDEVIKQLRNIRNSNI